MLRKQPRQINPQETFDRLVAWIENKARDEQIPGVIVGLSGTDSLLVFLACARAFERIGRPEAIMGVHFIHDGQNNGETTGIACDSGDKHWFRDQIMPWLRTVAPDASYAIDTSIPTSDDNKRWGNLFSRAIRGIDAAKGLANNYRLVAGTRNRSERALGTYTLISKNPSLQPIEHLYKTEVLAICGHLGVPEIALQKSREVDCDCGRFEVQANHLDELDYFIMTEQGELCPSFLEGLDPDILKAVRAFYIEERATNAFREKIPYKPTRFKVALKGGDVASAIRALEEDDGDVRALSKVTPLIVIDRNTEAAHRIVTTPSSHPSAWRPEAFTLLGTAGLTLPHLREMMCAVFGPRANDLDDSQIAHMGSLTGRLGQYGFSFPAKRFTTMRLDDRPSLIEQAGFTRHIRPNDIRDHTLPKSDPARDEMGAGFVWHDEDCYIEQRRGYLVFANLSPHDPVTLIIRNSSYFFGRDRLSDPVYVSFTPKSSDELLSLTRDRIENLAHFTPWHALLESTPNTERDTAFDRIAFALKALDDIDMKFSQWLRAANGTVRFVTTNTPPVLPSLRSLFNGSTGFDSLRQFAKQALLAHVQNDRAGSPFYLSDIVPGTAPWQPRNTIGVTTDMVAELNAAAQAKRRPKGQDRLYELFHPASRRALVLMSGQYGDFPLRPEAMI